MTLDEARDFIESHGIVLESANGPVPSLAAEIAGERFRGSWWSHPKGEQIWAVTRRLRQSEEILVCRLIEGKVTYVHRRLWLALVRLASRLPEERVAAIREVHTKRGHNIVEETPFPAWVPPSVLVEAESLSVAAAAELLGIAIPHIGGA